jgi:hypothetical protein
VPPSASPRRESAERPAAIPSSGVGLAIPPSLPCECRSNDPATPAPKPESRPDDHGTDQGPGELLSLSFDFSPAIPVNRPAACRPTAPLYLRTTRLLI